MKKLTTRTRSSSKQARASLEKALLCAAALAGCFWIQAARQDSEVVEGTRELVRERMAVQRLIWEEKRDWELSQDALTSQIDLRKQEIETLTRQIEKTNTEIGEVDVKIAELTGEETEINELIAELTRLVTGIEADVKQLLPRLPEFVQDKVRPLSQQFPEKPEETKLGISLRYANLAAVLNEIVKANGEINLTSEVRTLDDGRSAEVAAFYVGLGKAYYVTATGDAAGVGTAGPESWEWSSLDAAAQEVALAISILKNEESASFVRLPVEVD
jgi:chromosome segregation ATPase